MLFDCLHRAQIVFAYVAAFSMSTRVLQTLIRCASDENPRCCPLRLFDNHMILTYSAVLRSCQYPDSQSVHTSPISVSIEDVVRVLPNTITSIVSSQILVKRSVCFRIKMQRCIVRGEYLDIEVVFPSCHIHVQLFQEMNDRRSSGNVTVVTPRWF